VGGGDGSDGDGIPVTGIALSESALTLQKGEYASLSAEVSPDDATDPDVTWTSANDGVATVNRAGLVKGMDAGTTKVLAMSDGRMAECDITVVNPVTHVALNKTSLKLNKGASQTLVATVAPDNATDKSLWWTTSNADICTIDADGKVTAVSPGTAEIAVEARSGGEMASCQVTVESPVSGVNLNKTEMTLRPGVGEKLTATVTPEDATNPGVMWASSDPEICTVDQDGNVTAIRAGTAVISATAKDNVHMAQCAVTVTIPVTGVTLNTAYLSIIKDASDILYATVWPADATNKAITWSSSNSAVCSVNQSGVITGTGVGTATITATTQDGGFTASCTVEVKPNTYVVSANAVHGHVEGTGTYWAGMNVTLTAVPDYNYEFVDWTNSSGAVIGTSTTYTIYNLSADVTVTANFRKRVYTWTHTSSSVQCNVSDNANKNSMYASFYTLDERALQRSGQVVYTFNQPVVLPAGSGIDVTCYYGNSFSPSHDVAVDGVTLKPPYHRTSYGSVTNDMYRYASGTTIHNITVSTVYGSRKSSDRVIIIVKIVPLGADPFILNFTDTSANQVWPEQYDTCQESWNKGDYAVIVSQTQMHYTKLDTEEQYREIAFHYYQPMDVESVDVRVFTARHSLPYFSFRFSDIYNNEKEFTSRHKSGNNINYNCTSLGQHLVGELDEDLKGNYLFHFPMDQAVTGDSYPQDGVYVYNSVIGSKVSTFKLGWGSDDRADMWVTVNLKNGTSFNIIQGHN